jgi:ABC-type multidrug transport system fused ATPase/permease subunit
MDNDVGGLQDVVSDAVFGLVTNALVAAPTLALMFVLSWQRTLAALFFADLPGPQPLRRPGHLRSPQAHPERN